MSIEVNFDTVQSVTSTWDKVLKIPDVTLVAGELLFRKIFDIAPGAWKLFPFGKGYESLCDEMFQSPDFKSHAKKVVGMLDSAVQLLGPDLDLVEGELINLGARHIQYGVLPEHYPIVGQALLHTLATALGDDFTPEVKDAWAGLYGFVTTSMLKGANQSLLLLSFPLFPNEGTGSTRTLDEYISNMIPGQKDVYYTSSSKGLKHSNVKVLQHAGAEILYVQKSKEEMIVQNLQKYVGRKVVNVEDANLDLKYLSSRLSGVDLYERVPAMADLSSDDESSTHQSAYHPDDEDFCSWFQTELGQEKVVKCTPTCKFASLPARVIHDGEDIRETMRKLEDFDCVPLPKKHVEVNMSHAVIVALDRIRKEDTGTAQMIAEQLYDNCLINAGLLDEGRAMVNRINELLLLVMTNKS